MNNKFDIIIIGAGSVGVPIALYLAMEKYKVLIIEKLPSPGQDRIRKQSVELEQPIPIKQKFK